MPAGAAPSLQGYLYQVDVTIFLALDLLLAKKSASEIIIEPAEFDDVEADLNEFATSPTTTGAVSSDGYRLVVQAKMRGGKPWGVAELKDLLTYGVKRTPASVRLKDPNVHYLLVTSAALGGNTHTLRVLSVGAWPGPGSLTADLAKELPADAEGRIGVFFEEQDKLKDRILKQLVEIGRVPHGRKDECLEALRKETFRRMVEGPDQTLGRELLIRIIRDHEGLIVVSRDLENFVKPQNWEDFQQRLDTAHAVIIRGPSGSGKTLASERLAHDLVEAGHGYQIVTIKTPDQLKAGSASPKIFMLEDPWGKYRLEPTSPAWHDELPGFIKSLGSSDRKFIVTSRDDVLGATNALKNTKAWQVHLEGRDYGSEGWDEIFEKLMKAKLPSHLHGLAITHKQLVLDALEQPLEMSKFFDELATPRDNGAPADETYLRECIKLAQIERIANNIRTLAVNRDDQHWAGVIWALLKLRRRQKRSLLSQIQHEMGAIDKEFEDGLEPYVQFLVNGQNLSQPDDVIAYAHPQVEEGLAQAMVAIKPGRTRRALGVLIQALLNIDANKKTDWGRETAAHVLAATLSDANIAPACTPEARKTIDAWLEQQLVSATSGFGDVLRLAAAAGSAESTPAELARWLLKTREPKDQDDEHDAFFMRTSWGADPDDDAWYERLKKDASSAAIARAFVVDALPPSGTRFPPNFHEKLRKFAPDITSAFIEAATDLPGNAPWNDDVIFEGALEDLDAFQTVNDGVFAWFDQERAKNDAPDMAAHWLSLHNDEFDEEAANHYYEQGGDERYTAEKMLRAYVDRMREKRGWEVLAADKHAPRLAEAWIQSASTEGQPVLCDGEALALASASRAEHEERFWNFAASHWNPVLRDMLAERLRQGHTDAGVRAAAASCALAHAPELLTALLSGNDGSFKPWQRLDLLLDAHANVGSGSRLHETLPAAYEALLKSVDTVTAEIARAYSSEMELAPAALGAAALDALDAVPKQASPELRLQRAWLLACGGRKADAEIRELVQDPYDYPIQAGAYAAAVKAGLSDVVSAGPAHKLAEVKIASIGALAPAPGKPLPDALKALAHDAGGKVQETMIRQLRANPHPDNAEALAALTASTWSKHAYYEEDASASYPHAREAAEELLRLPAVPGNVFNTLVGTLNSTSDSTLSLTLLEILIVHAGAARRANLLKYAMEKRNRRSRLAAMALAEHADLVEPETIAQIEPDLLVSQRFRTAAALAWLIGQRAELKQFNAAAAAIRDNADRRAFLLVLGNARQPADETAARQLAAMLPEAHPARALLEDPKARIARAALDDLGDVRACDATALYLGDRIEEPDEEEETGEAELSAE